MQPSLILEDLGENLYGYDTFLPPSHLGKTLAELTLVFNRALSIKLLNQNKLGAIFAIQLKFLQRKISVKTTILFSIFLFN
jgi:hypothetical protein